MQGSLPTARQLSTLTRPLRCVVEAVVVYHGGEWRRAVGSVNARLNDQCRTRGAGVAGDLVERAWLTLSQRRQADAFRQAQWRRRHQAAA